MVVDALKTYLETQKDNCKCFKVPIETCFDGETIISVFIVDDRVLYSTDNNGYLFHEEIDEWIADDIINHLLETENIYIPIDD